MSDRDWADEAAEQIENALQRARWVGGYREMMGGGVVEKPDLAAIIREAVAERDKALVDQQAAELADLKEKAREYYCSVNGMMERVDAIFCEESEENHELLSLHQSIVIERGRALAGAVKGENDANKE